MSSQPDQKALMARIAQLSPQQRELLLRRMGPRPPASVATAAIPRRTHRDRAPLSLAQRRLWFLDRLEPGNPAYHLRAAVELSGPLSLNAFIDSLNALIERHEALRTSFQTVDGEPYQQVETQWGATAPVIDLTALDLKCLDSEIRNLITEEPQRPFDLTRAPLIRFKLLRATGDRHVVLLTLHHIVGDGWSLRILISELKTLYGSHIKGIPSRLKPLTIQYADFANWQTTRLQSDGMATQVSYWKKQLEGHPPNLQLPLDWPRPSSQRFRGALRKRNLPATLSIPFLKRVKGENATLFMGLMAVFQILLHRHSGQHDILVGTPIAGRNRSEIEDLIGFFINTLVIRTQFSPDINFNDLLGQVRTTVLGAYAHQDLPFEQLVELMQPKRELSRTPIFQVMLNLINFAEERLELPEVKVNTQPMGALASKFDLTLYAGQVGDSLQLNMAYNTALFSPSRIDDMLGQIQEIMKQVIRKPQIPVSQLDLLTPPSYSVLPNPTRPLAKGNTLSLLQRISENAARWPDRTAVMDRQGAWSYGFLLRYSLGLAQKLIEAGLGPGERVAIYDGDDGHLAATLLAVMKSGATFLTLDPRYPQSHLEARLTAAHPKGFINLAQQRPTDLEPCLEKCQIALYLEPCERNHNFGLKKTKPQPLPIKNEHPLYLAFTSGTTGAPKCILGTEAPISHFLNWYSRHYQLNQADRFSMLSGLSHDPLLRDLLAPFWLGASLHIPARQLRFPGEDLLAWAASHAITVMHLTPAMGTLLSTLNPGKTRAKPLRSLRYAFFGGDRLYLGHAQELRDLAPGVTCVNFYGTTETPQAVAAFTIPQALLKESPRTQVPIGQGIDRVQLLVLGSKKRLAGIGELGQIYVRSPYLCMGYLNQPDPFVTNPFGQTRDRLYPTGDFGRFLPNGQVSFHGRRDRQVKVRGFRVELEEIEATLSAQTIVDVVYVSATWPDSQEPRITAYVVPKEDIVAQRPYWKAPLEVQARTAMVPYSLVVLEAIPMTPNGKVDVAALPEAFFKNTTAGFRAPFTPLQELLTEIWGGLLHRERIGIHDHFFELGGHSLLAVRMFARLRATLNLDLPVKDLFNAPTIAQLADIISSKLEVTQGRPAPNLRAHRHKGRAPLSFAQQRLWVHDRLYPEDRAYHLPVVSQWQGALDCGALDQALKFMIHRHEILRTTFGEQNEELMQTIHPQLPSPIRVVDLSRLKQAVIDNTAKRLCEQDSQRLFNLRQGPLFRTLCLRLSKHNHQILFCMHHIVSDGWSMGILLRETAASYAKMVNGTESLLDPMPVQYADYALWQRKTLQEKVAVEPLEWWRRTLLGAPSLKLPEPTSCDFRASAETRFPINLKVETMTSLRQLCRQESVTPFMALLAVYHLLLNKLTGQTDICVGTPVAGRNRVELESLIGLFVNTLVMRLDLSGNPPFRILLQRTRQMVLAAHGHQDLPFEKIVAALRPERRSQNSPFFKAWFVLQNTPRSHFDLPGLKVTRKTTPPREARHGLRLGFTESQGQLIGSLEIDRRSLDSETGAKLAGQYQTLVTEALRNPQVRIAELGASYQDAGRKGRRRRASEFRAVDKDQLQKLKQLTSVKT